MPARPAPAEATLGKPQLWADGTSCESITGAGGMQARDGWTIAFWCWWTGWCWVNTGWGQCWEFLGCFWRGLEHKSPANPSDMIGEGQPRCLHPTGSCPGKGDTDPTAKHLALPCPGHTTTPAGLGPAPDCQGMVLWLLPLSAGLPHHSPGHQTLSPPESSGGEWGLAFPDFTCSGGQRAP